MHSEIGGNSDVARFVGALVQSFGGGPIEPLSI